MKLDLARQILDILWPLVGGRGTEIEPLKLARRVVEKQKCIEFQLDEARRTTDALSKQLKKAETETK